MVNHVLSTPILQQRIAELADKRVEVEELAGLLGDGLVEGGLEVKRTPRRGVLRQSLQEVAEKWTEDMICKMESKTFIRGAYYVVAQLLTRAYHQGEFAGVELSHYSRTFAT